MTKFTLAGAAALLAAATMSGTAIAGEITGNGTPIDVNARSECAFSGQNDTPLGDPRDPGGQVQSYGYLVGHWGLVDPQGTGTPMAKDSSGSRVTPATPIAGMTCTPNKGSRIGRLRFVATAARRPIHHPK